MDKRLVIVSFLLGVALTALGFMTYLYVTKAPAPMAHHPQQFGTKTTKDNAPIPPIPQIQPKTNKTSDSDSLTKKREEMRKQLRDKNRQIHRFKNRQEDIDKMMQALNKGFDKDFDKAMGEDFENTFKKMRERMQKLFEESGGMGPGLRGFPGGNSFGMQGFGGDPTERIKRKEDDKNIYFELDLRNVDEESLEVNIQDGQISISGQTVIKTEDQSQSGYSSSSMVSSFSKSFPVPNGVKEDQVSINKVDDNTLRIKFPK